MLIRKTGIVLQKRKTGDSDLIIDFLSEDGELTAIRIHGIRKSVKRSALIAEPVSEIEIVYYEKENLSSHKEAVVINRFENIKNHYGTLNLAAQIMKLAKTGAMSQADGLYALTTGALHFLDSVPKPGTETACKLLSFYIARLLTGSGFMADSLTCSLCGSPVQEKARWLAFAESECEASFECQNCSPYAQQQDARAARYLDKAVRIRFGRLHEIEIRREDLDHVFKGLQRLALVHFSTEVVL